MLRSTLILIVITSLLQVVVSAATLEDLIRVDLVPATENFNLPEVATGKFIGFRGHFALYTWFAPGNSGLLLKVTGGQTYTDRGDVEIKLYSLLSGELVLVDQASVPPDKKEYEVLLTSPAVGLHLMEIDDNMGNTNYGWPENWPMTLLASDDGLGTNTGPSQNWTGYFYVPEGTKTVSGFTRSNRGIIRDSDKNALLDIETLEADPETERRYFDIPVPAGQDGKLWKLENIIRHFAVELTSVPPFVARNEKELLLPKAIFVGPIQGTIEILSQ